MGLTFDKLLIIGVIAVFLLGPERLPHYASQLARLVRTVREMANGAKERMREEMGPDFDDVDWKKLDPRQYDPRRIIREALLEDDPALTSAKPSTLLRAPAQQGTDPARSMEAEAADPTRRPPADTDVAAPSTPFDSEST